MTNDNYMHQSIAEFDPELAGYIDSEKNRQNTYLEMIASENFVPKSILEAQGSILTNKYAEGYPGKRYYGGCEFVDDVENLTIKRVCDLFGAEAANVQPHSGASANAAVLRAIAKPGDTILGLDLSHGGHLTHGMKLNFSGHYYNAVAYGVNPDTYLIDMDELERLALEHKPSVIIAGWSAYTRVIDFPKFREIADKVGAKLWVDMAHFAGLVAAGLHPNPTPYADVVSSTVHKTLGGPRSGFILMKKEYEKSINSAVFPGVQGGPLMHAIAGKAIAFKYASSPEFKNRIERTLEGSNILAATILEANKVASSEMGSELGVNVLTGGTDVHLVLIDLQNSTLDGQTAEDLLDMCGITVNRNSIPFDPRPPSVSSGLRIGTAALSTRGFGKTEFEEVANIIATAL
ncbi:MAG: serine hydroxymethyltransferase, partial [Bifidobacteriaceae bacterium]|nr:serine hydroxymethyltransferase [Bifidobacteriaceae bacterium]